MKQICGINESDIEIVYIVARVSHVLNPPRPSNSAPEEDIYVYE